VAKPEKRHPPNTHAQQSTKFACIPLTTCLPSGSRACESYQPSPLKRECDATHAIEIPGASGPLRPSCYSNLPQSAQPCCNCSTCCSSLYRTPYSNPCQQASSFLCPFHMTACPFRMTACGCQSLQPFPYPNMHSSHKNQCRNTHTKETRPFPCRQGPANTDK